MTRIIQAFSLIIILCACNESLTSKSSSSSSKISATITYRERIALPPGSSLQLKIIPLASNNADLIIRKTQLLNNAPPFSFDIEIPEKMRQSAESFVLQADIKRNEQTLFTATKNIGVLNHSKDLGEILVKRIKPQAKKDEKLSGLVEQQWELIEIYGQPIHNPANLPMPWLKFEANGRLLGFTGCNQTQGKYKITDEQVQLRPGVITNKFCIKATINEKDFLDALKKTANIEISNNHLLLIGNDKSQLGAFQKKR
jgi:putative lipoprotein